MNNAGQHGRQPTPQAAPSADPRIRNVPAANGPTTSVTESSGICRDFIWGICAMGAQCIYRHDLEFEAMKETLKFCHDHQNRTGCTRPDCTYLHTSRDEENLFLTTGQIPRVLIDRYANMSYVAECGAGAESVPPHLAMYEFVAQPPPPPPPPPPPAQSGPALHSPRQTQQQQMQATLIISPIQGSIQGAMNGAIQGPMPCPMPSPIQSPMQGAMPCPMPGPMPGPMQGPMPCPMPGPIQGPMQGPMQHPMQGPITGSTPMPQLPAPMQPPPPPPPPTSSVSSSRMSAPVYTGGHPPSSNLVSAHYQPATNQQSLPALFDPTRPPPPIFQKPSKLKRSSEGCEARPSKLRKSETSNESSCEKCVQRLISIELYTQQIEQIKQENEKSRAQGAARVQDFERKKRLIQSFLSPEMYRLTEEYIENRTPAPSISTISSAWSEVFSTPSPFLPQPNSNNSSSSSLLNSLLGLIVSRERDAEPAPATSDAALLQQLTSRMRPTTTNGSTDFLTSFFEMVRNSPSERISSESRSTAVSVGKGLGLPVRSFSEAGTSTVRPYEGAGPSSSRPYEGAGPVPPRPYEGAGPAPSRPYDGAGPSPSRPYDGAGPSPSRPYDGAGPLPSRPYDTAVASTTYTEMSMAPYEPVRYPPPASTAPAKSQYHSGMELSAMTQGARPTPAPTVQIPGPVPYGSPQTQVQAQGPPSRPPFYVQMPPYNGANPPYPGPMPQAGRPPMQPPQNPPNNFFFGTRYPNYYPPYQ